MSREVDEDPGIRSGVPFEPGQGSPDRPQCSGRSAQNLHMTSGNSQSMEGPRHGRRVPLGKERFGKTRVLIGLDTHHQGKVLRIRLHQKGRMVHQGMNLRFLCLSKFGQFALERLDFSLILVFLPGLPNFFEKFFNLWIA